MNILLAQSLPSDGHVIQRTIEEVDGKQPLTTQPASTLSSQAANSVFFGLAGVLLIIVAIGAVTLLWTKHPMKLSPKTASKPRHKGIKKI